MLWNSEKIEFCRGFVNTANHELKKRELYHQFNKTKTLIINYYELRLLLLKGEVGEKRI